MYFNLQGEAINRISQGDDRRTLGRVIELNLQNDHYSAVINGEQKNAPSDGDYFFTVFLLH